MKPCIPLTIKAIMILFFKILTLFQLSLVRSGWFNLIETIAWTAKKGKDTVKAYDNESVVSLR